MGKAKCAEPSCTQDAKIFIQRRDKLKNAYTYCSVSCAQKDHPRLTLLTQSVVTVKSGSDQPSETYRVTLPTGLMISKERSAQKEKQSLEEMRMNGTIEIKGDTGRWHERDATGEYIRNAKEIGSAMKEKTPMSSSNELSTTSNLDDFQSESLIDSSIKQAHSLAKSVMIHAEENIKVNNKVNPNEVNAACNTLKQLHALMKLKVYIRKRIP